jgi:uncharacterized membrane protein
LTRSRYGNVSAAEHLELILVHHDDRVGINPDTQEFRMRCDYRLHITFAMTFGNMLIYCAIRYKAKTSLVAGIMSSGKSSVRTRESPDIAMVCR